MNELTMAQTTTTKGGKEMKKSEKTLAWLQTKKKLLLASILSVINLITFSVTAFAADDGSTSWNTVMDFLLTWIPRIGGAVLFFGAVEFAFAFKSEDAEGKTKAMRTMVAGAMVVAIPLALGSILKI